MKIKPEIRVIGIDDAPFKKEHTGDVLIVGSIFRSGIFMDGLLSCYVKKDGLDATDRISKMINESRHKDQLRVIFLNGVAVAGFNIIDIQRLNRKTNLPVIIVIRDMPNFEKIKNALSRFKDKRKRLKMIKNAGKVHEIKIKKSRIFVQFVGIDLNDVRKLLKITCTHSLVPEPLRISHLIASGIVEGHSRGKA